MQDSQDLLSLLRSRGFRITPAREKLIEIFCRLHSPVSAADLTVKLDGSAHKTTLYRELQFLVKQKMIKEVDLRDQIKRYELSGRHHHHAVCVKCKIISDVALPELCPPEAEVTKQTGFTKVKHSLEFFGLCQTCSS